MYIITSAKLAGKDKREMLSGLAFREKATDFLASIPVTFIKK